MAGQQSGGTVVTIGDWAIERPYVDHAAYFVSKGAIPTLTKTMAVELAARNPRVRVNCIHPGPVMTPPGLSEEQREARINATLVKQADDPETMVKTVLNLPSGPGCVVIRDELVFGVMGSAMQGACVAGMALAVWKLDGWQAGLAVLGLLIVFSLSRGFCSVSMKDVQGKCIPKSRRGRLAGLATTFPDWPPWLSVCYCLAATTIPAEPSTSCCYSWARDSGGWPLSYFGSCGSMKARRPVAPTPCGRPGRA